MLLDLFKGLIEIKFNNNNKKKDPEEEYVKVGGCHTAMDAINQRISDLKISFCKRFDDVNTRIDDLKDMIEMAINLLNKK